MSTTVAATASVSVVASALTSALISSSPCVSPSVSDSDSVGVSASLLTSGSPYSSNDGWSSVFAFVSISGTASVLNSALASTSTNVSSTVLVFACQPESHPGPWPSHRPVSRSMSWLLFLAFLQPWCQISALTSVSLSEPQRVLAMLQCQPRCQPVRESRHVPLFRQMSRTLPLRGCKEACRLVP